jgi:hypothetical protein
MSKPMTGDQWREQLTKFNVPFVEVPGFDSPTSGRDDETGLIFGPVFGFMIHHTGSDGNDSINRNLIINGRSDLPGPLAQCGLNDNGVIDLITVGRANHAGGGDPDVLEAVKSELYNGYPPDTDKHQGESGAVDGNDAFYGLEVYYSGGARPTRKAYRSMVRWGAAICDFHGWSAKSGIGHREWSDYKIDPGNIDMKVYRADVQRVLDNRMKEELDGPKLLTPNITKAIAANIAYDKALKEVTAEFALGDVAVARETLKKQRRALRDLERR